MAAYLLLPTSKPVKEDNVPKWILKYTRFLLVTLRHRKLALSLALLFLIGSVSTIAYLPAGFMPEGILVLAKLMWNYHQAHRLKKQIKRSVIWRNYSEIERKLSPFILLRGSVMMPMVLLNIKASLFLL